MSARRTRQPSPGDGSALRRVSGLQWLWRGQFVSEVAGVEYAVDVDFLDLDEKCRLYRDGIQVAVAPSPARFEIPESAGTCIEAAMSTYGMKRAHVVDARGARLMTPAHGTAEAWRQRLAERRPRVSIALAAFSLAIVLAALLLEVPQALDWLTHTEAWGQVSSWVYRSPIALPTPVNTALTVAGVVAGLERALRLKHRWLLDE